MADRTCSIDGCDRPHRARGWCLPHWKLWRKYGDPEHRKPGEVRDGKRICPRCHEDKPRDAEHFTRHKSTADGLSVYCRPCASNISSEWYHANHEPDRRLHYCRICLRIYVGDSRQSHYCSPECAREANDEWMRNRVRDPDERRETNRRWRERHPEVHWAKEARRRARKKACHVDDVDRNVVFERDGWLCGLCESPIDPDLSHPDPLSPSIDHVVPLSRGGDHSYANCQAAHLRCNIAKGVKLEVSE